MELDTALRCSLWSWNQGENRGEQATMVRPLLKRDQWAHLYAVHVRNHPFICSGVSSFQVFVRWRLLHRQLLSVGQPILAASMGVDHAMPETACVMHGYGLFSARSRQLTASAGFSGMDVWAATLSQSLNALSSLAAP